jgi:hypothetical protein
LDSSLLFHATKQLHHIQLATQCPPYKTLPKNDQPIHIHPKMANTMFAELSTFNAAHPEKPKWCIIKKKDKTY